MSSARDWLTGAFDQVKDKLIGTPSTVVSTYNDKPVYSIPTGLSVLATDREDGDYYLTADGSIGIWKNAEKGGINPLDAFASIATAGISDAAQGENPGAGLGKAGEYGMAIFNPAISSGANIAEGIKTGDYGKAIENLVDPITEPGLDMVARGSGEALMDVVPELVPYAPAIGAAIGGVAGNVPGALAGYELGNKIAGGSHTQALVGGATIGATAGLGSVVSPYISSVMPTGTVGNVLAGAGSGAVTGAAGALPNAIETGNYNNLLTSALIGGTVGGIGGGFKQPTSPNGVASLDSFGLTAPSIYDSTGALTEYGMGLLSNNLSGLISAPGSIDAITNAYLNSPNYTPSYNNVLPDVSVMPGINPYSEPFSADTIKDAYGLPDYNTPTLNSPTVTPEQVYSNAASQDMFYRPSTIPGQIGTLGKVYDKSSDPFTQSSPSAFDTVREYAGKAGSTILKNADLIKKIANAFSTVGAPGYAVEEAAGGPSSTPDTEWLSNMITSGTGVGKSKGLLAGEVEGPGYNGESFMPGLREIKKYDKQNLYYS